jgi:hypothetical protein
MKQTQKYSQACQILTFPHAIQDELYGELNRLGWHLLLNFIFMTENINKFKYPAVDPTTGLYQEEYLIKHEQKNVDRACACINKWCRYLFCGDKNAKISRQDAPEVYSFSNENHFMQNLQMAKIALNYATFDGYEEAVDHFNIFLTAIDEYYIKEEEKDNLKEMKKDINDIARRTERIAISKKREEEVNQIFLPGSSLRIIILALNQSVSEAMKNQT